MTCFSRPYWYNSIQMTSTNTGNDTRADHPCNILGSSLQSSTKKGKSTSNQNGTDTTNPVTNPATCNALPPVSHLDTKMLDRLVKQCVHTQQSSNKSSSIVYSHNTTKQGFIVLETHQLLIVWRNVDATHDTLIILIIIIVSGSSFRIRVNCAHGKICQNDTYSKEENGKTCSTVDCSD